MNNTKTLSICLLNQAYTIKCPEKEEENLKLAAQKLHMHMQENKNKFKQIDNQQALLLAALHLSHELITSQATQAAKQEQLSKFINSLENKISEASGTALAES